MRYIKGYGNRLFRYLKGPLIKMFRIDAPVGCIVSISKPRTNYCKKSLSYSEAVLWNSLPLDIRQSPSLDEFKSKLMNYHFDSRCM